MWLMVQFSITACCCLRPAYSICFPIHHNNCSLATGRCFALVMCFILRSPTQPVHYNSLQCSYNIAHPSHCTVCMDLLTQCFNHPMLNAQFDNTWPQNLCLIDSWQHTEMVYQRLSTHFIGLGSKQIRSWRLGAEIAFVVKTTVFFSGTVMMLSFEMLHTTALVTSYVLTVASDVNKTPALKTKTKTKTSHSQHSCYLFTWTIYVTMTQYPNSG